MNPEGYERRLRALFSAEKGGEARSLAAAFLKAYPRDFNARYCYAVSLSELTAGFSRKDVERRRWRTVVLLRRLMKERRRLSPLQALGLANEYYWFSNQPRKQYELGRRFLRRGVARAHYSCGVGAAMLTLEAARKGDAAAVRTWFGRAQRAWRSYHARFAERMGSVLFEAIAWGASGDLQMMEKRLRRCCALAKVPARNHSILWARREVRRARGQ